MSIVIFKTNGKVNGIYTRHGYVVAVDDRFEYAVCNPSDLVELKPPTTKFKSSDGNTYNCREIGVDCGRCLLFSDRLAKRGVEIDKRNVLVKK